MKQLLLLSLILASLSAQTTVEVTKVVTQTVDKVRKLPGEITPYQSVDLTARVAGYIEELRVDVGSAVKKGDIIARLSAPEMDAQLAEARSRIGASEAQRAEADAKVLGVQATYDRLKAASATTGAIAGNELVLAEKQVEAARSVVRSFERSIEAGKSSVRVLEDMKSYLEIRAPFDGVVTQRYLHPGALGGPQAGPLVKLQQLSRLRLIAAVPEADLSGLVYGARIPFTVPAFPGETFGAVITRVPRVLDPTTRTMPIELDLANPGGRLAPGMYPELQWPVRKGKAALLVPPTAIVTTTERSFVIRITGGKATYVNVKRGAASGELVEVQGALAVDDVIVKRGTDELREGTPVRAK
ncbi:MAG: efflux RND transporter periplasmic adaptor subunit [Bryobacteraceae bacterium]|nr:efflux RND transporter periplasmic adaptor subunit [Bryobacteraceae bacterium]